MKKNHVFSLLLVFFLVSCSNNRASQKQNSDKVSDSLTYIDTLLNGYWVYEKNVKVVQDEYSREQEIMNPEHKNDIIYIKNDSIEVLYENCKGEIYQRKTALIELYHSKKTVVFYQDFFKEHFDLILDNSILVVENSLENNSVQSCQFPYNQMLLIKDRLFLHHEGFAYSFTKIHDSQRILKIKRKINDLCYRLFESGNCKCENLQGNLEEGFTTRCEFEKTTIEEVYLLFMRNYLDESKHLLKELPKVDEEYENEAGNERVSVNYQWKTTNHLVIELSYEGGTTFLSFDDQQSKIIFKIVQSPD